MNIIKTFIKYLLKNWKIYLPIIINLIKRLSKKDNKKSSNQLNFKKMENLKKALEKVFNATMTVDKALEDGKITGIEWVRIAGTAVTLPWIFTNFKVIVSELHSLTIEQKTELSVWAKEKFDIHNDVVESVVEEALMFLLGLANLKDLFGKARALNISNAKGITGSSPKK